MFRYACALKYIVIDFNRWLWTKKYVCRWMAFASATDVKRNYKMYFLPSLSLWHTFYVKFLKNWYSFICFSLATLKWTYTLLAYGNVNSVHWSIGKQYWNYRTSVVGTKIWEKKIIFWQANIECSFYIVEAFTSHTIH